VKLPRVSLTAPHAPFVSVADRIARITFAAVDADGPLVVGVDGACRTVVVVWPTDALGYVHLGAVRSGRAQVLPWEISPAEVEAARELVRAGWDLAVHDVLVGGGPVAPRWAPTPETLRGSAWWPEVSEAHVGRLLDAPRTNAGSPGANGVRTAAVRTAN
jgi:hypothetical protein